MTARYIHDLAAGAPPRVLETDICIVGTGPVGLTLACGLADFGHRVTLVEAGGAAPQAAGEDAPVRFGRRSYRGATIGRALGLGGTSALWGGQLLPVRPADLLARPQIDTPDWPLTYAEIEPYFGAVQRLLGVRASAFDLASSRGPAQALRSLDFSDWAPRLSQWLAFGKRNLATALQGRLQRSGIVDIWVNARAGDWELSGPPGARRVRELTARAPGGQRLRVQPAVTVIAGGALDSARSVLEIDRAAGSLSPGVSALTGRFLHDHLSLRLARVHIHDAAGFAERFAPHFDGATMRSLRMELPVDTLERAGLPALYAHFIAETPEGSGFAVARDLLRAAQGRNLREVGAAARRVPGAIPELTHLVYSRWVRGRLAFPAASTFFLHVDVEQAPRHDNRVSLDKESAAGDRLHIDWDVEAEAARIAAATRPILERFWQRNGLNCIATAEFLDLADESQAWNHNVYDLYHPAGTTRMAQDPAAGVVDPHLKIHGTANAYVAGASVFPSMGAANPTFTAMALGLRLAGHLDRLKPAA